MPKKRSQKTRKPLILGPLDKGAMVGLTRAAIRKKGAVGYGKKSRMRSLGKDWTHKDVRKILEYMYDRKIFSNKLDTRARTIRFMNKMASIEIVGKYELEMRDAIEDYLYQLFERHKIKPDNIGAKKELISNFKTTMELIGQRYLLFLKEVRAINPKNKKGTKGLHITINARDSFVHVGALPLEIVVEDILNETRAVENKILSNK